MSALAPMLQAFFTERLIGQRQASPNTVAAYRDTMRLLLGFVAERVGKQPSQLEAEDIDAPLVGAFLNHLERERGNGARTRNARLAAIRLLFRFAALRHPEHAATIERVLAIPPKRFRAKPRLLPQRARARRAAQRSGPRYLDGPSATGRCSCSPPRRGCGPPS